MESLPKCRLWLSDHSSYKPNDVKSKPVGIREEDLLEVQKYLVYLYHKRETLTQCERDKHHLFKINTRTKQCPGRYSIFERVLLIVLLGSFFTSSAARPGEGCAGNSTSKPSIENSTTPLLSAPHLRVKKSNGTTVGMESAALMMKDIFLDNESNTSAWRFKLRGQKSKGTKHWTRHQLNLPVFGDFSSRVAS